MSLKQTGYGELQQSSSRLGDILSAQLELLFSFFPMQVWLVGRIDDTGALALVACRGLNGPADDLQLLNGAAAEQWALVPEHPGFHYRWLESAELARWQLASGKDHGGVGLKLLRYPIRDSDGNEQGWLFGLHPGALPLENINRPGVIAHVRQVLVTIALAMSMHADLGRIGQQLVEVQRNAFTEPLTGVLNRAGWTNRVEHLEALVQRSQEDIGIFLLDLDLLKLINDHHGHSAGDALLQHTAERIVAALRASDVVGRLGGDEFGIAVQGVDREQASQLEERIRQALVDVDIDVSMGMALRSEAESLAGALKLAD